jgi:hypothetical protein
VSRVEFQEVSRVEFQAVSQVVSFVANARQRPMQFTK